MKLRFLLLVAMLIATPNAFAEAPKVVTSIGPLHSLTVAVMEGVGVPKLLISGGQSPHSYSLKPSDARVLNDADAIFWIGKGLETFLDKALHNLDGGPTIVALSRAAGVIRLPARQGGIWELSKEHDHAHEHIKPEDEKAEQENHGHKEHGHKEHGHKEHEQKEHEHEDHVRDEAFDPHIWLDPQNAQAMVAQITKTLTRIDPANKSRYAKNAIELSRRLGTLKMEIATTLAPIRQKPYFVFHDAYQYFERRFRTNALGSIAINPERAPGAKRLYEIRARIRETGARCVFSEPQFRSKTLDSIIEGTQARIAVLDPLGAGLKPGPEAYFSLMRGIAAALSHCGRSPA